MFQALSNDELHRVAPSIFADQPWHKVSPKYTFIPTIDVVNSLRAEGFMPVKAMQSISKTVGKENFTKHLIRFRREQDVDSRGEIPELVVVNSHDRTSSYQLSAGIFRLVCSNGMVVKSASFGDINVHHTGDIKGEIIEGSYTVIEQMPKILESMNKFKTVMLDNDMQMAYATAALTMRYNTDENGNLQSPITPESILTIRRREDYESSLWNVFNRAQENFVKGGLVGRNSAGKRYNTKGINSVSESVRINKALWMLTEKMAEILQ
jgi:hypothetical protein